MHLNINYTLDKHGWSDCIFFINGNSYEMTITHIFPNHPPIESCINALLGIMKGETERTFYWFGEPGGEKICIQEMPLRKDKVRFVAENCDHLDEIQSEDNSIFFELEVSKKTLITLFYFEFKKISVLMKDKHFSKHRNGDFPFLLFKNFELNVQHYLALNE